MSKGRRKTAFKKFHSDLDTLRSGKRHWEETDFIEKHKNIGLSHDVIRMFWRASNVGFGAYELTATSIHDIELRSLRNAGFTVKVRKDCKETYSVERNMYKKSKNDTVVTVQLYL